jgi:hypothetical protein
MTDGSDGRHAALIAEYAEVNSNFRLLTDIRFKLLAFLPLVVAIAATATGAIRTGSDPRQSATMLGVSLFGLVVTVALVTYNARNDQIYVWLVERGARIERELGLPDGSFAHRPNAWLDVSYGLGRWHVGHSSSIAVMYLAAVTVWLAGCLIAAGELALGSAETPLGAYVTAVALALTLTVGCSLLVRGQKAARRRELDAAARDALEHVRPMRQMTGEEDSQLDPEVSFVNACVRLMGRDHSEQWRRGEVRKRIRFYAKMDVEERRIHGLTDAASDEAVANYLSLIVDLPPSLLLDHPQRR